MEYNAPDGSKQISADGALNKPAEPQWFEVSLGSVISFIFPFSLSMCVF